ncbi:MAG: hypothetical protein Q9191_005351 [Dirinaria sp. TL-2023a]
MDPPPMKTTRRAIEKRRSRRDNKALHKSLKDISGTRTARQLREQFNYLQRQNRAWLQQQVQLPSRGGITIDAESELKILFGKSTKADEHTNLPTLDHGKELSPNAEQAWERLRAEREAVDEETGTEFTPDWFERGALGEKKTRGERRARARERERLENEMSKVNDLSLGDNGEERDSMETGRTEREGDHQPAEKQ